MSWTRLKYLVQEDGSFEALSTLGRSVSCLNEYHHFKDTIIMEEYVSVLDYVMIMVFGCGSSARKEGTYLKFYTV